jgi:monofunctional biosynthetic peptidoglycan transglycosylase
MAMDMDDFRINLYRRPCSNIHARDRESGPEETAITLMIEGVWDKRRIFEVYLNVIEWGDDVFGAEAAARHYFGLAGMVPDPRFHDRNRGVPGLAAREALILSRMPSDRFP